MGPTSRRILHGVLGLSVAAGMGYWGSLWFRGGLTRYVDGRAVAVLVGSGVVQILSWAFLLLAIRTARDVDSPLVDVGLYLCSLGVLFATALYYFTPAAGAPFAGLCILGLVLIILMSFTRNRATRSEGTFLRSHSPAGGAVPQQTIPTPAFSWRG